LSIQQVSAQPPANPKIAMIGAKAMYQFAIDVGEENSYTPAAPQGVEAKIFEKLALSIQPNWWAVPVWVLHSRFHRSFRMTG
jgi:hypothetical protein